MELSNPTDFSQCPRYPAPVIGDGTRNSSGNQAIVGVGFVPRLVEIYANITPRATNAWSHGWDTVVDAHCVCWYQPGPEIRINTDYSIMIFPVAPNYLQGALVSFDADGFTIGWNLSGVCACEYVWLAFP